MWFIFYCSVVGTTMWVPVETWHLMCLLSISAGGNNDKRKQK